MRLFTSILLSLPLATSSLIGKIAARDELRCSSRGYDKGQQAYFYSKSSRLASAQSCGSHCTSDPDCKSFAIGSGACLHYSVSIQGNFELDSSSAFLFYDRGCFTGSSASTRNAPTKASTRVTSRPSGRATRSRGSTKTSQPPVSLHSTKSRKSRLRYSVTSSQKPAPSTTASCGGTVGYNKPRFNAYYYDDSGTRATFDGCAAICKAESCASFAFGANECLLYSSAVSVVLDRDAQSPYRFYDALCIPSSSSTDFSTGSSTDSHTSSSTDTSTSASSDFSTLTSITTTSSATSTPSSQPPVSSTSETSTSVPVSTSTSSINSVSSTTVESSTFVSTSSTSSISSQFSKSSTVESSTNTISSSTSTISPLTTSFLTSGSLTSKSSSTVSTSSLPATSSLAPCRVGFWAYPEIDFYTKGSLEECYGYCRQNPDLWEILVFPSTPGSGALSDVTCYLQPRHSSSSSSFVESATSTSSITIIHSTTYTAISSTTTPTLTTSVTSEPSSTLITTSVSPTSSGCVLELRQAFLGHVSRKDLEPRSYDDVKSCLDRCTAQPDFYEAVVDGNVVECILWKRSSSSSLQPSTTEAPGTSTSLTSETYTVPSSPTIEPSSTSSSSSASPTASGCILNIRQAFENRSQRRDVTPRPDVSDCVNRCLEQTDVIQVHIDGNVVECYIWHRSSSSSSALPPTTSSEYPETSSLGFSTYYTQTYGSIPASSTYIYSPSYKPPTTTIEPPTSEFSASQVATPLTTLSTAIHTREEIPN